MVFGNKIGIGKYEDLSMIILTEALDECILNNKGRFLSEGQKNTVLRIPSDNRGVYGYLKECWIPEEEFKIIKNKYNEEVLIIPIYGMYSPNKGVSLRFLDLYVVDTEGVVAKYSINYAREKKRRNKFSYIYDGVSLVWDRKECKKYGN